MPKRKPLIFALAALGLIATCWLFNAVTHKATVWDKWQAASRADHAMRELLCAEVAQKLIGLPQAEVEGRLGPPDRKGVGLGIAKIVDKDKIWDYEIGAGPGYLGRALRVVFDKGVVQRCEIIPTGGGA